NREIFSPLALPPALVADALRTFPTFEAYMDAALHHPRWGYYTRRVIIGRGGHFLTHPEEYSPDYGRWLAEWAFKAWRELLDAGELSESEPFPILEFGAGNGRLARDLVDAIASRASEPETGDARSFASFAKRASYRIYETSESLRARQQELLGSAASIAPGDARRPAETLKRDFPSGVKGFVVTNEVPDAFGVHKVVLSADGEAFVALVVPRVERALLAAVSPELAARIRDLDASIRSTFGFGAHGDDCYLDQSALFSALEALAPLPVDELEERLGALWFEEAYVPAAAIPELAQQLSANASDYALALAAEDSGVVHYVNVHATRFVRELAASMTAGFIVTIDYGDSTFGLVQGARRGDFPFRVYRDASDFRPRPNDPYAAPGTQDMTADVNFSELARAGRDAGLTVVHFGHERDVAGEELPELLRSAAEHPGFAKLLGTPVFKVLVLGTRSSDAFSGPLASPLPLSRREQDIPKARRAKIASIERTLATLVLPR
ncbi:MAG TPA: SAM-dependent methyltransferase, partial [Polyangiaceae bacterium]|nr:SAM-dependent methyltransferase [Polyangiaceae bacterium]